MDEMTKELLAQSRAYGTTEERIVLALEMIADQLRALVAPIAMSKGVRKSTAAGGVNSAGLGTWENEGGSLEKDLAASLGIKHSVTDQFETGGFRYTKLSDAIAEAKRARANVRRNSH